MAEGCTELHSYTNNDSSLDSASDSEDYQEGKQISSSKLQTLVETFPHHES